MKIIKIIFGALFALFVLLHILSIPSMLGREYGDVVVSVWIGKLTAMFIGSGASFLLFRSAFAPPESGKGGQ